jgi:predicted GNAT family acetyltransferase
MAWHLTDSIEIYAEHVWDLLAARADLNTLALTQIASARSAGLLSDDEPTFAWWRRGGRTAGAVSATPPYELLLNLVPEESLEDLVTALRRYGTSLPGVNGAPETAARFAELWTAGTSLATVITSRLRLYAARNLTAPQPAPGGRARHAAADEFDLIVGWYGEFARELGNRPTDERRAVRERIDAGLVWVWEDEVGTPTSVAARHPPAAGVSRIGPVYTPPAHRRHGFGAAVSAACSRDALETDSTVAVLFADADNPTSNALYQRIGYRPLEDRVVLGFTV